MKYRFRLLLFLIPLIMLNSCGIFRNGESSETSSKVKSNDEFLHDAYFLEALRMKMLGQFDAALLNFEKAAEYSPDEAVLYFQIAEMYTQLQNFEDAIKNSEKSVKLDPENIWYHILLAQLYQNGGLFADAAREFEQIIRLEPNKMEYYFYLSGLYQSIGQSKSSIDIMNKAETQFGILDIISVEKEQIYEKLGKSEKSIKEIEKLIEVYPDNLRYKALLAELYISLKKYSDAKNIYLKLDNEENTDGTILFAMSEFYQNIGEFEKSFGFLKRAFADPELNIDLKVEMLVSMITTTGNSEFEIKTQQELFDVLIQAHPSDPKALTVYSDFLVKIGNYAHAKTIINEVLLTVRDKYPIWEQLLYVDNYLEDYYDLIQVSDTAISLFPNMPIPYLFNSLAAYQLKMNKKSIEVAERGLVYVIDNPSIKTEFMTFIAESYYRENEYEKSDSVFDEILLINPDNIYILNNYAYYLSLRGEKLVKAKNLGERLVKLAPNNPNYLDTYAWVLFVSEDYIEAEKYVSQAYDLGGKDRFTIVEHYGDIMYKLGNKDDALKYWKQAAELNKPSEILQNKIATGKM